MKLKLPQLVKSPHKFVLSIGDDGAILVYMQGKEVLRRLFAPTPSASDVETLTQLLANNPQAPLYVLIDLMDQSYMQQTLPPVSPLSIRKLINRRLERDFPPDDIKGALPLGRTGARKDWSVLFVSLANTPVLKRWLDLVSELANPCKGIYLLPVEAEQFLRSFDQFLEISEDRPPSKWQLLVSHHKIGGFRQVIFKEGKLLFTRLAQPIGENTPRVIAGNIEQEILNTIEYIKRLGFDEQSGLDVVLVLADDIKQVLDISHNAIKRVMAYTPFEAGERLELKNAAQVGDHYGDVVMAASFGERRNYKLRLFTPYLSKLANLYLARISGRIATGVLSVFLLIYTGTMLASSYTLSQNITFQEKQKKKSAAAFNALKKQTSETAGGNFEQMLEVADIYALLSENYVSPLNVAAEYGATMGTNVLVKGIDWKANDFREHQADPNVKLDTTFDMTMIDRDAPFDKFLEEGEHLVKRLQDSFKDYDVAFAKAPGGGESQSVEIDFNSASPDTTQKAADRGFQILITAPKSAKGAKGGKR